MKINIFAYLCAVSNLLTYGSLLIGMTRSDELNKSLAVLINETQSGGVDKVRELLNSLNINVNIHFSTKDGTLDEKGLRLLHIAAANGNIDMMRALIDAGAKVDLQDAKGRTPLFYAVSGVHLSALEMLIVQGASLQILDEQKRTPLHAAFLDQIVLQKTDLYPELLQALDEKFIIFPSLPYHTRLEEWLKKLLLKNDYENILLQLVNAGVALNGKDMFGKTPAHYADVADHQLFFSILNEYKVNLADVDRHEFERTSFLMNDIFEAVKADCLVSLRHILRKHSDAVAGRRYKFHAISRETPLHIASSKGNVTAIALLLDEEFLKRCGTTVEEFRNAKQWDGKTALHLAATNGHQDAVSFLLTKDNSHVCTDEGETPLHLAAMNGHTEVAKLLVESYRADLLPRLINIQNSRGETPLILAVKNGLDSMVKLLVESGAQLHVPNCSGLSALHYAAEDNIILKALCAGGSRIADLKDLEGESYLIWLVRMKKRDAIKDVLGNGADITLTDNDGHCALYHALMYDTELFTDLLIKLGTDDVTSKYYKWSSIRYWACRFGDYACIKALFERERDRGYMRTTISNRHIDGFFDSIPKTCRIDTSNVDRCYPIHCVAEGEMPEKQKIRVLQFFLTMGVPVDMLSDDKLKRTALACVVEKNEVEAAQMLITQGADVEVIPLAGPAQKGNLIILHELIEAGSSVHKVDVKGNAALHGAVLGGHYYIVLLLLKKGAKVNALSATNNTPLIDASRKKTMNPYQLKIVQLLIDRGADPCAQNHLGNSALHYAAQNHCSVDLIELLIRSRAAVNLMNSKRKTPLHLAVGDLGAIKVLLQNGANVNAADEDLRTPLHYLNYYLQSVGESDCINLEQFIESVTVLLKHGASPFLCDKKKEKTNKEDTEDDDSTDEESSKSFLSYFFGVEWDFSERRGYVHNASLLIEPFLRYAHQKTLGKELRQYMNDLEVSWRSNCCDAKLQELLCASYCICAGQIDDDYVENFLEKLMTGSFVNDENSIQEFFELFPNDKAHRICELLYEKIATLYPNLIAASVKKSPRDNEFRAIKERVVPLICRGIRLRIAHLLDGSSYSSENYLTT